MRAATQTTGPSSSKGRWWSRRIVIYPALIAAGYIAWLIIVYTQQDRMLFPGAYSHHSTGSGAVPAGSEQVWLTLADGSHVEAWFTRGAARSAKSPGPALIFTHGNAESIEDWAELARTYGYQGLSVLLVEYPGYGRSSGKPSEASITETMNRAYDWLTARPEVDASKIVFHGRSIGGGAAAALARTHPPAALILESAPASVAALAHGYGVPEFLCRNPFRTDEVVATLQCPILIFHGTTDQIVPVEHARRLHQLAPQSELIEMDSGHNDGPADLDAYWDAIAAFLMKNQITTQQGRR